MDTKLLLFAQIVEDFSDVKKLYKDGEAPKAYKLFEDKLKEIKGYALPRCDEPSVKGMKIELV